MIQLNKSRKICAELKLSDSSCFYRPIRSNWHVTFSQNEPKKNRNQINNDRQHEWRFCATFGRLDTIQKCRPFEGSTRRIRTNIQAESNILCECAGTVSVAEMKKTLKWTQRSSLNWFSVWIWSENMSITAAIPYCPWRLSKAFYWRSHRATVTICILQTSTKSTSHSSVPSIHSSKCQSILFRRTTSNPISFSILI